MMNHSADLTIREDSLASLLNRPGYYPPVPAELADMIGRAMIDYVAPADSRFFGEDYTGVPAKRASFKKCSFEQCNFREIGAASSSWDYAQFKGCQFRNANFQYARLSGAKFLPRDSTCPEPNVVDEANFSAATLQDAALMDLQIMGSSFAQADFSFSTIKNCRIRASSLEGVSFVGANISDVDFTQNNLEYCDFTNASCYETRISLLQFPYLFGVNHEILKSRNGLIVASSKDEGGVSADMDSARICALLPSLANLFESRKDFFPLANVSLMLGDEKKFQRAVLGGIKKSILLSDYRSIRYFCKMARLSDLYQPSEMDGLFNLIRTSAEYYINNQAALNDYRVHEGAIRQELIPAFGGGGVTVQFTVTPKLGAVGSAARVLGELEAYFKALGLKLIWHHLEINRNSPETCSLNIEDITVITIADGANIHLHQHIYSTIKDSSHQERLKMAIAIANAAFAGLAALAATVAVVAQLSGAPQTEPVKKAARQFWQNVEPHAETIEVRAYHGGTLVLESAQGRNKLHLEAIRPGKPPAITGC